MTDAQAKELTEEQKEDLAKMTDRIMSGEATIREAIKFVRDIGGGMLSNSYKEGNDDTAPFASVVVLYGADTQAYLDAIEATGLRLDEEDSQSGAVSSPATFYNF